MQISMQLAYAGGFKESAAQAAELEKAGLDIAWVAEAYGFDGVSLMGYLAATTETIKIAAGILPIYTRTPTLLAMTAAGLERAGAALVFTILWLVALTQFGPVKSTALVFPGIAALWLATALYLFMLGLVAEVALRSEQQGARATPTAWEVG